MTWYITGVSRGLGSALALLLLDRGDRVIGIGRSASIDHPRFQFISCDLRDLTEVRSLSFPVTDGHVALINNAGILGKIGRISQQEGSDFEEVMTVNCFAPYILTQNLYAQLAHPENFCLLNVSSGAGRRSIPSWAAYCASKAALDRWTENFYLEESELGRHLKVYSVAPGVVDTDMQGQIRDVEPEKFSGVANFIEMKAKDLLFSPEHAAKLLLSLVEREHDGTVCVDLRQV